MSSKCHDDSRLIAAVVPVAPSELRIPVIAAVVRAPVPAQVPVNPVIPIVTVCVVASETLILQTRGRVGVRLVVRTNTHDTLQSQYIYRLLCVYCCMFTHSQNYENLIKTTNFGRQVNPDH